MNRSLVLLTGIMIVLGCQQQHEVAEEEVRFVEAIKAQPGSFEEELEVSGNIRPWEEAYITGQAGVQIASIYAEIGSKVKKGEVLVRMKRPQISQAGAQLQQARREVERMRNLHEVGAVSKQQLEQAQVQLQTAQSGYAEIAQNTSLTSPISGVVSEKNFVEGEVYAPSATTSAILIVEDIVPVKMVVSVSNRYYTEIKESDTALIKVDNFPERTFIGTVYKKSPTIQEETRTFELEIKIENKDTHLRPGMFAHATFNLGEQEGMYVPASAILKQPGTEQRYIFIVREGRAVRRVLETGIQTEGMVQITNGLAQGETIVVEGAAKLEEGDSVKINPGQ